MYLRLLRDFWLSWIPIWKWRRLNRKRWSWRQFSLRLRQNEVPPVVGQAQLRICNNPVKPELRMSVFFSSEEFVDVPVVVGVPQVLLFLRKLIQGEMLLCQKF